MGTDLEDYILQLLEYLKNNLSKCSSISSTRGTEANIISNENDILQILSGVKILIRHYFFEADYMLTTKMQEKLIDSQSCKKSKEFVENTRNRILNIIGELLIKSQKIWKLGKPKVVKNFKLSHSGILPFTDKCYTDTLNMYYKDEFTFGQVSKEFTSYQSAIINILKPVVETYPEQTIKSILNVWISEHEKNNDDVLRKIVYSLITID